MSKSVLIKLEDNIDRNLLINRLEVFFIKEINNNELLLSFNNKWIWLFFEDSSNRFYNLQFSSDFDKDEIIVFLDLLTKVITYEVLEICI